MIGQRLDKALSHLPEVVTRSRAEHLLDKGCVWVDDTRVKASYRVQAKDQIWIDFPVAVPSSLQKMDLDLDILFEDEDLLVVNKPAGLVVHPAAGHEQDTLVNALLNRGSTLSMKFGEDRPGIVHRLDRDTSGLLVVAKNDFTHEHLAQQFQKKSTHRIYFAAVLGKPKPDVGTIQSFLHRHPTDRKRNTSIRGPDKSILRLAHAQVEGKWAVTHYEVLQSHDQVSLLKLRLETGRTHQIRVHLSELQCPLWADPIYGSDSLVRQLKNSDIRTQIQNFPRLALHAAELGFVHPRTQQSLLFVTPWPNPEGSILQKIFPGALPKGMTK